MRTLGHPEDRAQIARRLTGLCRCAAPRWGRLSAPQMVCHLADSFRMLFDEKEVREASTLFHRTLLKWLALYAPLRWPAGIRTRPEIDPLVGGTPAGAFAADVAQLLALLERVAAERRWLAGRRHPVFGPLSESAWLRWGYLHMDHHLRQFGA